MPIYQKPTTRNIALTASFTALYVVFGFIKISPIIGLTGQAITAAAITAPLIGMILGPYVGTLSTFLGGVIGFFFGSFSTLSLASGVVTALCGGLIRAGKRIIAILVYALLFLLLAFYPVYGPVWLLPAYTWFQIVGFVLLISPLQSIAAKGFSSDDYSRLLPAFLVTSLTSTLAGQIAGTLTLEISAHALIIYVSNVDSFRITWETTMFLYPVERIIIALSAALIGVALFRVLKPTNLMPSLNSGSRKGKFP